MTRDAKGKHMAPNSVDELMDLLHACRGARSRPDHGGGPVDLHDHALRTAALLRRRRPADKELQLAGLVHGLGALLHPNDPAGHAGRTADAVRPLLGERVARLVLLHAAAQRARSGAMNAREASDVAGDPLAEDAVTLLQAGDEGRSPGVEGGVLEDWRPVLEAVAAAHAARASGSVRR
jgi:predicted HD phosphohydrolase